jgi:aryl-alcohol dehydrogenase-like predicted oxidoreductase
MQLHRRMLGRTGRQVTLLGLGGEGVLRTFGRDGEASALIERALDRGIAYCESARAYAGSEAYYGKTLRERRKEVFLASKSHARDREGALAHLRETLSNLRTDHLDLWQVHDVRTEQDISEIFGKGGAIEAFAEAKRQGLARSIGVTGHHDPGVLRECIERFDFDTVLMPVNPAETGPAGFLDQVLPVARRRNMGIIGMKVYFRGLARGLPWYQDMGPFLRFALSQPVTTVVIGCDSIGQLEENAGFAHAFVPMSADEQQQLVAAVAPFARQLRYYRA